MLTTMLLLTACGNVKDSEKIDNDNSDVANNFEGTYTGYYLTSEDGILSITNYDPDGGDIPSYQELIAYALLQKSFTTDFLTKKSKINEGEVPQYYVEGNHEAIIAPDTFNLVQKELSKRNTGRNRHSGLHIFSSKIKCGECGSWYGSKVWHSNDKYRRVVWQCNHKFDGDTKCSTPHLTENVIMASFVSAVNRLLENKASIDEDIELIKNSMYDTTELSAEQTRLTDELTLVAELVQQAITENSTTALDQTEYQKRYDSLSEHYNDTKEQLDAVTDEISQKELTKATLTEFQKALRSQKELLTKFDEEAWYTLVDYATIYSMDDIRFTFKNGTEIKA